MTYYLSTHACDSLLPDFLQKLDFSSKWFNTQFTSSLTNHILYYSYSYSFIQYSRDPQVDTELVIIITMCTVQNES